MKKQVLFIFGFVAMLLALHVLYEDNSYSQQIAMAKVDGEKEITPVQNYGDDITTIKHELVNLMAATDQIISEQKRDRSQARGDFENIIDRLARIEERLDKLETQNPQNSQVIHIRQNYRPDHHGPKRKKP